MPIPSSFDANLYPLASDSRPRTAPALRPVDPILPREVGDILTALLDGMREALGDNLVGIYLRGSLVMGDFDPATSDVDFFAVTASPVSEDEFAALAAMHAGLARLLNPFGDQLEGPYLDRAAARRYRLGERYPTIGRGEALAWLEHGANWALERWAVRERGITLFGPDPNAIFDPVSRDELRAVVRARLRDWADWANQPDHPDWQLPLGHKAYVVETMCRALCTLVTGELPSKPRAVAWALANLPEPWRSTVERSRAWRGDKTREPAIVPEVLRLVCWAASEGEDAAQMR